MPTAAGVSPGVSTAEVAISMIGFTLVYGLLAWVEVKLLLKYIGAGLPPAAVAASDDTDSSDTDSDSGDRALAFAY